MSFLHFASPELLTLQVAPLIGKKVELHSLRRKDMNGKMGRVADFHPVVASPNQSKAVPLDAQTQFHARYTVELDSGKVRGDVALH